MKFMVRFLSIFSKVAIFNYTVVSGVCLAYFLNIASINPLDWPDVARAGFVAVSFIVALAATLVEELNDVGLN